MRDKNAHACYVFCISHVRLSSIYGCSERNTRSCLSRRPTRCLSHSPCDMLASEQECRSRHHSGFGTFFVLLPRLCSDALVVSPSESTSSATNSYPLLLKSTSWSCTLKTIFNLCFDTVLSRLKACASTAKLAKQGSEGAGGIRRESEKFGRRASGTSSVCGFASLALVPFSSSLIHRRQGPASVFYTAAMKLWPQEARTDWPREYDHELVYYNSKRCSNVALPVELTFRDITSFALSRAHTHVPCFGVSLEV